MGTGLLAPGTWVQGASFILLWTPSSGLSSPLITKGKSKVSLQFWLSPIKCGCCATEHRNTLIPSVHLTCRDLHQRAPQICSSSGPRVRGKSVKPFGRGGESCFCKCWCAETTRLDPAGTRNTEPVAQVHGWYLPHMEEEHGWSHSCWRHWHCHNPRKVKKQL